MQSGTSMEAVGGKDFPKHRETRVSSSSDTLKLSNFIAGCFTREGAEIVSLSAIGASSVNQAVKAIAIAKGACATEGMTFLTDISFSTKEISGENKASILLEVRLVK